MLHKLEWKGKKFAMNIKIREYQEKDLQEMVSIWNEVVEEGIAFPQEEFLSLETGKNFFQEQTYCGVAVNMPQILF